MTISRPPDESSTGETEAERLVVDGNEAAARIAYLTSRGDRHLPDHPGIADGRVGRRLVAGRTAESLGNHPAGDRDAERGRGRRGDPRSVSRPAP